MKPRQRFVLITLATLVGMGLTIALGFWQLGRAAQKEALQARMEAPDARHLVDNALLLASPQPETLLYQHALLRGHWLAEHTLYLDNRPMHDRVGFYVITPLQLDGSERVVLVQRGWVPRNFEQRDKLPAISTAEGPVQVQGRLALPPGKLFELGPQDSGAIRQNLDLAQWSAQTHLGALAVLLTQTGAPSEGLLRDWPPPQLGVEKHYGYALQWFGMATALALFYLWYQFLKPIIQRPKDNDPHA